MADYNSKYSGEQIEQLLQQAGGGSTVTEQTVSGWGFTKNQGTVTGVKINGSTKNPSNGVVDLGTVVTDVTGKQDKLVSGTNIKTINNQSILGSGDIAISGGGGSDKVEAVQVLPEINGGAWTYHIPAGKFVELWGNWDAEQSVIFFVLDDPVEYTVVDSSGWTTEYSRYHFVAYRVDPGVEHIITTNKPIDAVGFQITGPYENAAMEKTNTAEFDIICAIIHNPPEFGGNDALTGFLALAPMNY